MEDCVVTAVRDREQEGGGNVTDCYAEETQQTGSYQM